MRKFWIDYNLSIVLACLFLLSWAIQTFSGWMDYIHDQQDLGKIAEASGYFWHWLAVTAENWQSEFLQLLTFVILTSFLIHKGSHESKDSDEKMQNQLDRIEERLERLTKTNG